MEFLETMNMMKVETNHIEVFLPQQPARNDKRSLDCHSILLLFCPKHFACGWLVVCNVNNNSRLHSISPFMKRVEPNVLRT